MLGCQSSWLLVYCTCSQRANMPTLTGSFQPACPYQALNTLLPKAASATSNWAMLDFNCTGSDPSDPVLLLQLWLCLFFPPFLSEEKASGTWQHWRHTHRCRKNIIKGFFPPSTHALLNMAVHQNQLCENIPDEVRFACTDDAGTRRAIVAPLVVLIELKGNKSDFSPVFGLINRQMGRGTQDI